MLKTKILKVRKKDVDFSKESIDNFQDGHCCPTAKAGRRRFKTQNVRASIAWMKVNGQKFKLIPAFNYRSYLRLREAAKEATKSNEVIAVFQLKPVV